MINDRGSERHKCLRHEEAMACEAFSKHSIHKESDGRWLLRRRDDSAFWTEIVCVEGRGLYVDGDIDPVVFRFGPPDPLARVAWMATRKHAWDRYFCEKASIGTGGRELLHVRSRDVAQSDIVSIISDLLTDGCPDEAHEVRDRFLPLPTTEYGEVDWDALDAELHNRELVDDSWVGRVPSNRMFLAHAALQRLHGLLTQRGDYEA